MHRWWLSGSPRPSVTGELQHEGTWSPGLSLRDSLRALVLVPCVPGLSPHGDSSMKPSGPLSESHVTQMGSPEPKLLSVPHKDRWNSWAWVCSLLTYCTRMP